jgi:hypothetical protein
MLRKNLFVRYAVEHMGIIHTVNTEWKIMMTISNYNKKSLSLTLLVIINVVIGTNPELAINFIKKFIL